MNVNVKKNKITGKGFTLVELLVVISIIGVLSSVVLAGVTDARRKSIDANIKSEVNQYRNLLESQKATNDSYASLQGGWFSSEADCDWLTTTGTSGFKVDATTICKSIVRRSLTTASGVTATTVNGATAVSYLWVSTNNATTWPRNNHYSIMVWLPGAGRWYCVGSSGKSYEGAYGVNNTGCANNP